jgi:1-acyl-sn-glycerol-3-phosphate acyltransferase
MSDEKLSRLKEQVYSDPRPKEHFDRFHRRARTREPNWAYEAVRLITSLYAYTLLRARAISPEKVPASGRVILAPNHFSFMDHFLLGCYIRRKVRFMAKSQLFKRPMQWVYSPGGVFPVRRGARDEEAFITAETILGRGGVVVMYCEGGRSRTGQLQERAKPGIGRLALESGAPVVPVAIYGSAKIRNWKRLRFPRVSLLYGDPLRFEIEREPSRERQQEVADQIFAAIRRQYATLQEQGHQALARDARRRRRAHQAATQP